MPAKLLGVTLRCPGVSLQAMPDDEIADLLTQIVKLERKVSDLTLLAQYLFALVYQTQRITDQQETAFKEIPKLLERLQQNEI
jgi:hypothetical protein